MTLHLSGKCLNNWAKFPAPNSFSVQWKQFAFCIFQVTSWSLELIPFFSFWYFPVAAVFLLLFLGTVRSGCVSWQGRALTLYATLFCEYLESLYNELDMANPTTLVLILHAMQHLWEKIQNQLDQITSWARDFYGGMEGELLLITEDHWQVLEHRFDIKELCLAIGKVYCDICKMLSLQRTTFLIFQVTESPLYIGNLFPMEC